MSGWSTLRLLRMQRMDTFVSHEAKGAEETNSKSYNNKWQMPCEKTFCWFISQEKVLHLIHPLSQYVISDAEHS